MHRERTVAPDTDVKRVSSQIDLLFLLVRWVYVEAPPHHITWCFGLCVYLSFALSASSLRAVKTKRQYYLLCDPSLAAQGPCRGRDWVNVGWRKEGPEIDRPRSPLAEPCWFCHFEQREIAVNWAWGGLWICVLLLALGKIAVCTWSLNLRSKFNNGYVYALSFLVLRIPFDVERVSSLL